MMMRSIYGRLLFLLLIILLALLEYWNSASYLISNLIGLNQAVLSDKFIELQGEWKVSTNKKGALFLEKVDYFRTDRIVQYMSASQIDGDDILRALESNACLQSVHKYLVPLEFVERRCYHLIDNKNGIKISDSWLVAVHKDSGIVLAAKEVEAFDAIQGIRKVAKTS
jgi:hypothetical protein